MALQYHGDSTIIWAAVRKTKMASMTESVYQQSRTDWKPLRTVCLLGTSSQWDTAFVPTSQGLLMTTDYGAHWTLTYRKHRFIGRRIIEIK